MMSPQVSWPSSSEIEAEALGLLTSWSTQSAVYRRGASVCVMIDPCQRSDSLFDVPISVQPLFGWPEALVGSTIVLNQSGLETMQWYGRLNQRNQVLFRGLERGTYQAALQVREQRPPRLDMLLELMRAPDAHTRAAAWQHLEARNDPALYEALLLALCATDDATQPVMSPAPQSLSLIPLPTLHLGRVIAASTEDSPQLWRRKFRNANGTLMATLEEDEPGTLLFAFTAQHRHWDGTIVAFTWSPQDDDTPVAATVLLGILTWSEYYQICIAEVEVNGARMYGDVSLPDEPGNLALLADVPAEVIRESVTRAATPHSRSAWQRLLEQHSDILPSETRAALTSALGK